MWTIKQHKAGYFYAENKNLDTADATWTTSEEAQKWADSANEAYAKLIAKSKAKAEARKDDRVQMPTRILTSRGDGWEGNVR